MKLTKKELSFLAERFHTANPLSLFTNIQESLQGDEQKTLEEKGLLVNGKLTEEAEKLLSTVVEPERCTRLVLKDGTYLIEKYTYKVGSNYTIVENSGGELLFSSLQKLDEVLFQLSQWVGMSDLKTFDVGTTLTNEELLVFFALVDLRRVNVLLSYLGKESKKEIPFAEIRAQLEKSEAGSLTRILTGNYHFAIPPIEDTKTILEQLMAKKVVAFAAGYVLQGEYEEFASKFLLPQTVVMLETFNLVAQNELAGAGVFCVCAGMREIISLVFRENVTEIVSLSGRQLLKMIEDFFVCPDVLQNEV